MKRFKNPKNPKGQFWQGHLFAIDLQSAFKRISYKAVTDGLKGIRSKDKTLKLINIYLKGRSEYVTIKEQNSNLWFPTRGIGEGLVGSGHLWNVEMFCDNPGNKHDNEDNDEIVGSYADDEVAAFFSNSEDDLVKK